MTENVPNFIKGCEPKLWNSNVGHVIGTKQETKILKSYLDKIKAGATTSHTLLFSEDAEITAEDTKCKYLEQIKRIPSL